MFRDTAVWPIHEEISKFVIVRRLTIVGKEMDRRRSGRNEKRRKIAKVRDWGNRK